MVKYKAQARHGRRSFVIIAAVAALLLGVTAPAFAITYGEPDGNDHPYVGSIVVDIPDRGLFQWCSGTLIAEDVFLTASHCTAPLDGVLEEFPGAAVLVTFDPTISESGTFFTGTWHTNPNYNGFQGQFGASDPGDVAVIVLDEAPGITPARLPTAGMLDELKANHVLKDTRFTAVGYGTVRDTNQTGFQAILDNLDRNRVEQGFDSLTKAWLTMPMTLSTGDGGTCYGDSGGPHFIHLDGVETNIIVSVTVTGDAPCKASDKTYRMDTESARSFLAGFVDLP
jgi:secreted trypsin-like serine protease